MPVRSVRLVSLLLAVAVPTLAQAAVPVAIAAALADTKRPDADRARDADRKTAALLAFAEVKPGQTVMDLMPGGGYFTRLFADLTGPAGHVVAYIPAEMAKPDSAAKLTAAMQAEGRTTVAVISDPLLNPAPAEAHEAVDLVWTSQNYHDLHNIPNVDIIAYNKLLYGVVKPGGTFIVLDHSAPAGSGLADTKTLHRIDAAAVRQEVEAAGFRYVGMTAVLANPQDDRTLKVFDPSIRGHTDQFVFKFVKPRR